jgi:hypothetical protein
MSLHSNPTMGYYRLRFQSGSFLTIPSLQGAAILQSWELERVLSCPLICMTFEEAPRVLPSAPYYDCLLVGPHMTIMSIGHSIDL